MSSVKVNERILEGIRDKSEGDKIIESFLINLIYEEADRPGQWRWKDTYKNLVDKSSANWEVEDAD